MKTLELSSDTKDIILESGYFKMVDGRKKLAQDLKCIIVEHLNSDPYNPDYGSRFMELIGEVYDANLIQATLATEVIDVLNAYQRLQLNRVASEQWQEWTTPSGFMSQLVQSKSELISQIKEVNIDVDTDKRRIGISVVVITQENTEVQLNSGQFVMVF